MKIGKQGKATTTVVPGNTAKAVGSGLIEVFSTPMMIALMEEAACDALEGDLESGQSSVGMAVNIEHLAASKLGESIVASATVTAVDKRKITFDIKASDSKKEIGKGTHTRYIIDVERFMSKL